MIYCDTNKYDKDFLASLCQKIEEIERTFNIKALFGGVYSSYAYGFDTDTSDIDFYLIADCSNAGFVKKAKIFDDIMLDVVILDFDYLITNSKNYFKTIKKYPSALHKGFSEDVGHCFAFDDYFTTQKFFETLISNCVWDSGYLKDNLNTILNEIDYFGVADYYFTRAYGNLKNHLSKEKVLVKRYMRAFWGYCILRQLVSDKKIPKSDVGEFIYLFAPTEHRAFLLELLYDIKSKKGLRTAEMHKFNSCAVEDVMDLTKEELKNIKLSQDKQELVIYKNQSFNDWLERELSLLGKVIESEHDNGKTFSIVGGNSVIFKDN